MNVWCDETGPFVRFVRFVVKKAISPPQPAIEEGLRCRASIEIYDRAAERRGGEAALEAALAEYPPKSAGELAAIAG